MYKLMSINVGITCIREPVRLFCFYVKFLPPGFAALLWAPAHRLSAVARQAVKSSQSLLDKSGNFGTYK